MIRLSLEIPTVMLPRWTPMVDLSFVLAHKVLQDEEYGQFFANRTANQEVILDNSTHEFGKPIPMRCLQLAADIVDANIVIAPDIVTQDGDETQYRQNVQWLDDAAEFFDRSVLGCVINGPTVGHLVQYVKNAARISNNFFFTFHQPYRLDWWTALRGDIQNLGIKRIHLLGMTSVAELRQWVMVSEAYKDIDWSVDTSKPLKLGVELRCFQDYKDGDSLRGGRIKSKHVLEMTAFNDEQIACIESNITYLKAICRGEA